MESNYATFYAHELQCVECNIKTHGSLLGWAVKIIENNKILGYCPIHNKDLEVEHI